MFAKIMSLIKAIKYIKQFIAWFNAYVLNKKQEGQLGKIQDGEKKIEDANKIADDMERLKKKAEGGKQIENSIRN